jgi:hypothetical protein
MNIRIVLAIVLGLTGASVSAKGPTGVAEPGQLILFETSGFNGDDYVISEPRMKVMTDWNIRSIAIHPGDKWQVCAKPRFSEPCITITQSLPDSSVVGITGQIGSARIVK